MKALARSLLAWTLAALVPFAAVEAGLRVAGWQPPSHWYDVGFDPDTPILVESEGQVAVAPGLRDVFRAEPFPRDRASGQRLVFAIGDSVVWGHRSNEAAGPLRAWPDVLHELLRGQPGHAADRVVNLGARTFASGRVEWVLREALAWRPDVVVASFGSSEYLEEATRRGWQAREARAPAGFWHLRVVQGIESMLARAKGTAGAGLTAQGLKERDGTLNAPFLAAGEARVDAAERDRIEERYVQRLDRVAAACEAAGVRLVLLTVPSNLRWPPVASRFADDAEKAQVDDAVRRAGELLDAGRVDEARALVQPLAAAKPHVASLRFRWAQVLDRSGDAAGAKAEYEAARDESAFPLRVSSVMNRAIRQVAADHRSVVLVDADRLFESLVPEAIPDERLFLDQNHPTEDAHRRIAEAILDALRRAAWPP